MEKDALRVIGSHEPDGYACPFCAMLDAQSRVVDPYLVYEDELVFSVIGLHWWTHNPGHALIIPKEHIETLYDMPGRYSDRIHRFSRFLALAMKAVYACDGVSTRQHNEPAGNQSVWHYHLHVLPRFKGDNLYGSEFTRAPAQRRRACAVQLREYFAENQPTFGD